MNIEDFSDINHLKMEINQRRVKNGQTNRYWAFFEHTETIDGCILTGTYGNGATPNGAIKDYAKELSGKRLVVNAMSSDRREFQCPELTY